jgi:hypothetical protein
VDLSETEIDPTDDMAADPPDRRASMAALVLADRLDDRAKQPFVRGPRHGGRAAKSACIRQHGQPEEVQDRCPQLIAIGAGSRFSDHAKPSLSEVGKADKVQIPELCCTGGRGKPCLEFST